MQPVRPEKRREPTGRIFNIMRYSVHDGPGIRTTVFFKGCSLRCGWCHNPEGRSPAVQVIHRRSLCIACGTCVEACPQEALRLTEGGVRHDTLRCRICGRCVAAYPTDAREQIGRDLSVKEVMDEIVRDRPFYEESSGGVTFSGGEPVEQPVFLRELLRCCASEGIHTAVDTSGAAPWSSFEGIDPYVDLFLYDLKLIEETRHQDIVGISARPILENLTRLAERERAIWVRIPILPGVNDDAENIEACGRFLTRLRNRPLVHLLPYHRTGESKWGSVADSVVRILVEPPSRDGMERIAVRLRAYGLTVRIGA